MSSPRLEVRLDLVRANAASLVGRLRPLGITVTGVTKATLGAPEVAAALLAGGVAGLGESRIENVERLRAAGITAPITLLRSPMLSQVERVVRHADTSLNSERSVLTALSDAAGRQDRQHGVVLMVEMGDLREGVLPAKLEALADLVIALPHLTLRGIGTNLACQSGVVPDQRNMGELSAMAGDIGTRLGADLVVVSGGNSANLGWALGGADVGRVNDLRLGEAILVGCEPLQRRPVAGLRTDAFQLVAEVIEVQVKPSRAWGMTGETAFGPASPSVDRGARRRVIVALGRQDVAPAGLHAPHGWELLGASSDHLVLDPGPAEPVVGDEVRFGVGYDALLGAMTSPFVTKHYVEST